jgi:serine/threonine-protein kinase
MRYPGRVSDDSRTQEKTLREPATRPRPRVDELAGQMLLHFRVGQRLGEGGMGVVYRGIDEKLHRAVAIKVLATRYFADERNRELIFREARSAAALTHPNIATIYDVHDAPDCAFYAMELVDGETLRHHIAEHGRVKLADALAWARQIALALACAHRAGIVHRDLKADNVMITTSGQVKLLDFGLAKLVDVAGPEDADHAPSVASPIATADGRVVGTPAYMAPEQARGEPVDVRADIFAFGVVLYEMLTGTTPFAHRTGLPSIDADWTISAPLRTRSPAVPRRIERLVQRCLAFDRSDRFADGGDLVTAIDASAKSRVSRARIGVVAGVGAVVVVAAAALLSGRGERTDARSDDVQIAAQLNEEGKALMLANRPAEAAPKFQEATQRDPQAKYFFNLCSSLYMVGRFGEGLAACRAIDQHFPSRDIHAKGLKLIDRIEGEMRAQNIAP